MNFLNYISTVIGYKGYNHLLDSTFHVSSAKEALLASVPVTIFSFGIKDLTGYEPPVLIAILVLFVVELYTGIKSSKEGGEEFSTTKFMRGFVKLFIYIVLVGVTHVFYLYTPERPIFGFDVNLYEWVHWGFSNWVIVHMLLSVLENIIELKWDKHLPLVTVLAKLFNLKYANQIPENREIDQINEN